MCAGINKNNSKHEDLVDLVKQYLADSRHVIELDDLVTQEIKHCLSQITDDSFLVQNAGVTADQVAERLSLYESVSHSLQTMAALLAYWAKPDYLSVLRKMIARMAEGDGSARGLGVWRKLRWYPTILLIYTGGIGAIAGENYTALFSLLLAPVFPMNETEEPEESVLRVTKMLSDLDGSNVFKSLSGYERNYVPRSEYLFKLIQPDLNDLLFLGNSYEAMFDRFEILIALISADLHKQKGKHGWAPLGRFAWKYRNRPSNPYKMIVQEAETNQDGWPPIQAGFFGKSYQRFSTIASEFQERLQSLSWH
jgi:hypothetical protein